MISPIRLARAQAYAAVARGALETLEKMCREPELRRLVGIEIQESSFTMASVCRKLTDTLGPLENPQPPKENALD